MAQKVSVVLTDDLNPDEEATQTVSFSLDGTNYEIDLSDDHAVQMREALALYVGAARRVGGSRTKSPLKAVPSARTGPDPKRVREWAAKEGIDVPERGRLPKDILVKFQAAN